MPILEAPQAGSDLCQGDLLKDVTVFMGGGNPNAPEKMAGVLVVSRECSLANKDYVVVALVRQFNDSLPNEETLDQMRRLMEALRDGGAQPDTFYLGAAPSETRRLCAKMDMLFTIVVPKAAEERKTWLEKHRFARLSADFVRALPVRLYWSCARVGFDDHAWYSTADLELVVGAGRKELRVLEQTSDDVNQNLNRARGQGEKEAKINGLIREAASARESLEKFKATLTPYETELAKRTTPAPQPRTDSIAAPRGTGPGPTGTPPPPEGQIQADRPARPPDPPAE